MPVIFRFYTQLPPGGRSENYMSSGGKYKRFIPERLKFEKFSLNINLTEKSVTFFSLVRSLKAVVK